VYMAYQWAGGMSYYDVLNFNSWGAPFAVCVCIWTNAMLQFWADHEKLYSMRWGTTEYEETEEELYSYQGEEKASYIDGRRGFKVVDVKSQMTRRRLSGLVMSTLSLLFVSTFAVTFYLKFWMITHDMADTSIVADVLNAVTIFCLDGFYNWAAVKATSYENCRTQTEFNDSLITKLFINGFCYNYAPTIYIAFFKKLIGDPCLQDSCMGELGQTLTVVFCAKSFSSHFSNYVLPKLKSFFTTGEDSASYWGSDSDTGKDRNTGKPRTVAEAEEANAMATQYNKAGVLEEQFNKPEYPAVFTDYNEISIQFGFIALFVTAFPVAPFLAMVLNFIEDRVDGWKLLHVMRRPWPGQAEDIGSWYAIFNIVSVIGILFNGGIICYTMDLLEDQTAVYRIGAFLIFCSVCFFARAASMAYFSLELEQQAGIQVRRQDHLCKKVIQQIPDDIDYEDCSGLSMSYVQSAHYYTSNAEHQALSDSARFFVHTTDAHDDDDGQYAAP